MIEHYTGYLSLYVGIVQNLKVNNKYYSFPITTEELSVIVALNFSYRLLKNTNLNYLVDVEIFGILQVYIQSNKDISDKVLKISDLIKGWIKPLIANMEKKGEDFKYIKKNYISGLQVQKLDIYIDTDDLMGVNLLNSVSEKVAYYLELEFNLKSVLKIFSNDLNAFPIKASFSLDIKYLKENEKDAMSLAKNIELISKIGFFEEKRAVINNKGIMNGILSVALATLNDTRAIEASVNKYVSKTGKYLLTLVSIF